MNLKEMKIIGLLSNFCVIVITAEKDEYLMKGIKVPSGKYSIKEEELNQLFLIMYECVKRAEGDANNSLMLKQSIGAMRGITGSFKERSFSLRKKFNNIYDISDHLDRISDHIMYLKKQ